MQKGAAGVEEGVALLAGDGEDPHVAEAVGHLLGDVDGLADGGGEGAGVEAIGEAGGKEGGEVFGTGQRRRHMTVASRRRS